MKILLATEFFPTGKGLKFSGGVEARTFFVARHLAKKNEVIVIASRMINSPRFEKMFNFKIYRVGPPRRYNPTVGNILDRVRFILDALKSAEKLDIDIVEGSNFISHFIASRIAKQKKIPVLAWYPDVWLGSWIENSGFIGIFGEILERINLFFKFDSYIAISKETAKKLNKFSKGQIHIIPCGIDQKEFEVSKPKFNNPTILCISRLTKYKNIRNLILAFAHLSIKLSDVRLIIVGVGPEYEDLRNLSKALNLVEKIKFISNLPRKKLIEIIKSSHIFSLPSYVEGFGIATIEACAAGLPYVNSNIPVQREVTEGGRGGFLVDPDDPVTFSQKFNYLLSNESIYKKKSIQSKELAKKYQWSQIANQTEEIYKSILSKNTQLRESGFR